MKSNGSKRKRLSAKVNAGALRLLLTSGKSQTELCKQHGISSASFCKLKRETIRNKNHLNFIYKGASIEFSVLQEENLRLKRENEILRQQREMLSKSFLTFSINPLQRGVS
jgi:transposase